MNSLKPSEMQEIIEAVVENIKHNFVLVPKNYDQITVNLNNTIFLTKTLNFVSQQTGVEVDEIKSHRKTDEILEARRLFSFFCLKFGSSTLTQQKIAEHIGLVNHATPPSHLSTLEKKRSEDAIYNKYIENLINDYKELMNTK